MEVVQARRQGKHPVVWRQRGVLHHSARFPRPVAEHEQFYSKPYPEFEGTRLVVAQHDNSRGDPVFSMFFKYASDGTQSGVADPALDEMIAKASAATGDERAALWSEAFAYVHDTIVADVLLFHMVGLSRVSERLDFTPTIATNAQLQLSEINFK